MFNVANNLYSYVREKLRLDSQGFTPSFDQVLATPFVQQPKLYEMPLKVGLAHRLVWSIPQDALANGWRVDSGEKRDVTKDFDAATNLADQLLFAWGGARQNGGGWLWIVDGDSQEKERREGSKVLAIHDLTMWEVTALTFEQDPAKQNWGRPVLFQVTVSREGISTAATVHHSRLVYIPGAPVTPDTRTLKMCYDISYLQLYAPIVQDLENGYRSNGSLLKRLSIPWVRMKDGRTLTASEGNDFQQNGDSIADKMNLLKEGIDRAGLAFLMGDDEMGWDGPSANGVRDLVNLQAERLSSVEGLPISKIMGQAPSGLSTDDMAGQRTYDKCLTRNQKTIITPVLLRIYNICLGVDPSREIVWPAPTEPTALEAAQTSSALAARDASLFSLGALTIGEIRSRFANNEELPAYKLEEYDVEPMDENAIFDRADAVSLAPTGEMASAANRALAWREEYKRGGTAVGVARARDLANGRQLSRETIGRMVSYFARHEVDRDAPGFLDGEGFPSAGRIAWDLWGGDAGRDWANRKMEELERAEE